MILPETSECPSGDIVYSNGQYVCLDNGVVIDDKPIVFDIESNAGDILSNQGQVVRAVYSARDKAREVLELYRQGLPIKEIMARTGIRSVSAIYSIIHANTSLRKRKSSHRKLSREEIAEICREYSGGASIYSIAKKWELSTSRVYYLVKKRCEA